MFKIAVLRDPITRQRTIVEQKFQFEWMHRRKLSLDSREGTRFDYFLANRKQKTCFRRFWPFLAEYGITFSTVPDDPKGRYPNIWVSVNSQSLDEPESEVSFQLWGLWKKSIFVISDSDKD